MCYGKITLRTVRWLTVVAVSFNVCCCIPGWTLIVSTGLRNDKVTPCSIVLLEKLIFPQSLRKFPAFCGTRWLIKRVHNTQPFVLVLNQINPFHLIIIIIILDWGPVSHFCPLEALQPVWLTPEVYCTIPVFLIVPTLASRCLSRPQPAVVP
jgi:hypothetical protein